MPEHDDTVRGPEASGTAELMLVAEYHVSLCVPATTTSIDVQQLNERLGAHLAYHLHELPPTLREQFDAYEASVFLSE